MNSENNQPIQEQKSEQEINKKERRELRRMEKEEQLKQVRKKRAFSKFIKWAIGVAVIIVIGFLIIKTVGRQRENLPGLFQPEQSRIHIQPGQEHPPYSSNPPTSGWHYDAPAQTGIYDRELPDEQLIHNMEHQHVWISYRPDLINRETVDKLAEITRRFGSKIIMAPRSKNDSAIALAAWEYLLKLDSFDEKVIIDFIQAHRGKTGPENIPDRGFKDFRENL